MVRVRYIGAALLAALTMGQTQRISDLAPADEYFGHTKISILELRHRALALKDDLHKRRRKPDDIQHSADALTDAYYDWSHRFPHDGWIPRTGWELATLYEELPGPAARDAAVGLLNAIVTQYPSSSFAANGRGDLARGVGVRAWPSWAGPVPALPATAAPVGDALLDAILSAKALATRSPNDAGAQARASEERLRAAALRDGDKRYARHAWELATLYEMLPGADNRERAIRMLAMVLDRYGDTPYAALALADLKRGVGER